MKILALAHALKVGGAQVSTLEFLELLKGRVELRIITSSKDNEFINELKALSIPYRRVPCHTVANYPDMLLNDVEDWVSWADVVWITDEAYLAVPRVKRMRNVPIVAHLRSYALICHWWAAFSGFKEVCWEKCSIRRIIGCKQGINRELSRVGLLDSGRARAYMIADLVKGPADYFRWRSLMKGVVDSIDGLIAVSNALWKIHISHVPDLGSKHSTVVYNPVTTPLKHVSFNSEEPYGDYVVYASGSNPVKGPHVLLKAWREVSKKYSSKLYMVGCRGSWVEEQAGKMGLKNVVFLSKIPPREYYETMFRAKATIIPSLWPEPFGRIPVEANMLGIPAVISDAGGLPETIENGSTGLVSRMGDAEDLASKLENVLLGDFNRISIVDKAQRKFDPGSISDRLIAFFNEVAGG